MRAHARDGKLGFFDGIRALLGGVGFIVGRPAMWGWALIPTLVATALFVALGALAIIGGGALVEGIAGDGAASAWATAGLWLLRLVLGAAGLVAAFLVALTLAQPLSGFALDAIARSQEVALGGRTWPDAPLLPSMLRSLRVTLTALALTLPLLGLLTLVTVLAPPAGVLTIPLKFVVTALAIAYDFLDYPLGLRGVGVRARLGFFRDNLAAVLGFGLTAAAILLIPGVGLLVLPFGVAGGARLVVLADRRAGGPPAASA